MKKLIGSLMMIGIAGETLSADERKFIVDHEIAGVVLFARNCKEPKQIHNLCQDIQSLRSKTSSKAPLFIGVDMEGGRVHRLKEPFTLWPAPAHLGRIDNSVLTFQFALMMGQELRAVGINLNFAPCADILTNPKNSVIGDRSLGSDPEQVAKHASALVRGYFKSQVLSCAKHFPGHGNTFLDSHFDLPKEIDTDLTRLEAAELIPFKRSAKARCDMIMTSHILFPKIDADNPVTFSEVFLQKILRESMRFRGVIVTDDLDMQALTKHYERAEIPVRAIAAGADLLLYCNEPTSPQIAIESLIEAVAQGRLDRDKLTEKSQRVQALRVEKILNPDPLPWAEAKDWIGKDEHKILAQAIREDRVPEGLLPE